MPLNTYHYILLFPLYIYTLMMGLKYPFKLIDSLVTSLKHSNVKTWSNDVDD